MPGPILGWDTRQARVQQASHDKPRVRPGLLMFEKIRIQCSKLVFYVASSRSRSARHAHIQHSKCKGNPFPLRLPCLRLPLSPSTHRTNPAIVRHTRRTNLPPLCSTAPPSRTRHRTRLGRRPVPDSAADPTPLVRWRAYTHRIASGPRGHCSHCCSYHYVLRPLYLHYVY